MGGGTIILEPTVDLQRLAVLGAGFPSSPVATLRAGSTNVSASDEQPRMRRLRITRSLAQDGRVLAYA